VIRNAQTLSDALKRSHKKPARNSMREEILRTIDTIAGTLKTKGQETKLKVSKDRTFLISARDD